MAANLLLDLDDLYNPTEQGKRAQQEQQNVVHPIQRKLDPNYDLLGDAFDTIKNDAGKYPGQDDLDDFGDFETAEAGPTSQLVQQQQKVKTAVPAHVATRPKETLLLKSTVKKPRAENVLFDAEDEEPSEDEDEFGAFEEV